MRDPTPYRWTPELYDARASFISARVADDLLSLLDAKPNERILDLGCGTGDLAVRIAATGAKVIGLDASAEMLSVARAKAPGLQFVHGDGQKLTFVGEFDGALSNAALHWMTDADAVAEGMARALRPGGRLVAEFGGRGGCAIARNAIDRALQEMGEQAGTWQKWYFPTAAEYAALLERHGFLVRMALLFDRPTRFEGKDGLATWAALFASDLIDSLGPRASELVHRAEQHARADLERDGGWVLDYVRVRVKAERL